MQMTIRVPDEFLEQVNHISLRTGLKKSDIARLAIKDFLERFDFQEQEDKPIQKASDLIGVVRSGISDLGRNHRRHILAVIRTRIGSPYVIAGMSALSDKVVGFEANGGFLVGTPFTQGSRMLAPLPTRDAVLPVLAVLAEARNQGCTVSELMRDLPQRFTYSDRLKDIPTEYSRQLLEDLFRGQGAEVRGQRSEVRGQRSEVRGWNGCTRLWPRPALA